MQMIDPISRNYKFSEVQNREIAKEDGGLDPGIGGQVQRFLIEKFFDRVEYLL